MSLKRKKLQEIYRKIPTVQCKGLCKDSCSFIKLGKKEYDYLVKELGLEFMSNDEILEVLQSDGIGVKSQCKCLKEGKCSIYQDRPGICRLFGVVKKMTCPFGCKPAKWLSDDKARKIMNKLGYFKNE